MHDLLSTTQPVQNMALLAEQSGKSKRMEFSSTKMPGNQPRETSQLQNHRKNKERQKVVAKTDKQKKITTEVEKIYSRISENRKANPNKSGNCNACGKCCDFDSFDHRLYVTTPELIYLTQKIGSKNIRPMKTPRCPYNTDNKCSIYQHRFAACRIFTCNADPDFQSQLTESTLKQLKEICKKFKIDYKYTDLKTALNTS
jgi:Fe-S-cluster containining protein